MEELQATIMIDGQMVASQLAEFEGSLEDLILEAFRLAKKSPTFATTEELQQRAGLAGVLIMLKESERHEEYARVEKELAFWKAMSAAQGGVPVDFGRLLSDFDEKDAVGLAKIWDEFRKEA